MQKKLIKNMDDCGMVLSHLFNDMSEVVNNGEVVMFVDDSNLIFVGNTSDLRKLKECIN